MSNNKCLIIAPSWVGDMIMAHSLIQELHAQNTIIDVLAPSWCMDVIQRMPEVNSIIEFKVAHGCLALWTRYKVARKLSCNNYTHAIVLPGSFKSALIPWFAKIPIRIGWLGEFRYGVINVIHNYKKFTKLVERYTALAYPPEKMKTLETIDYKVPKLHVCEENINKLCKHFKLNPKQAYIFCPGAAYGPSKQWPASKVAAVIEYLLLQDNEIWLLGSNNDKGIINEIMDLLTADKVQNKLKYIKILAGELKLPDSIDLMSCSKYIITNDSGLMHIGAAVGANLIAIYGSSSPKYTPPLSDKANILYANVDCSPCFKRECPYNHYKCMYEISASQVIKILSKQ